MLSEVPTKLPLTLKAYILSKDNLNSLEQWHPAHHVVNEGVTGGEVHQTVLCNEGGGEPAVGAGVAGLDGEPVGMLGGVTDFVFKGQPPSVATWRDKPTGGSWGFGEASVMRLALKTGGTVVHNVAPCCTVRLMDVLLFVLLHCHCDVQP